MARFIYATYSVLGLMQLCLLSGVQGEGKMTIEEAVAYKKARAQGKHSEWLDRGIARNALFKMRHQEFLALHNSKKNNKTWKLQDKVTNIGERVDLVDDKKLAAAAAYKKLELDGVRKKLMAVRKHVGETRWPAMLETLKMNKKDSDVFMEGIADYTGMPYTKYDEPSSPYYPPASPWNEGDSPWSEDETPWTEGDSPWEDDTQQAASAAGWVTPAEPAPASPAEPPVDLGPAPDCKAFQHVGADNTCVKNDCVCPNGTAYNKCNFDGKNGCAGCNPGFRAKWESSGESFCEQKVCSCHREFTNGNVNTMSLGQGAIGLACNRYGDNTCASCDYGLTLEEGHDGKKCEGAYCYCYNGDAVPPADCNGMPGPTGGFKQQCATCDAGFYRKRMGEYESMYAYDEWGCVLNRCTCENGNGAVGLDCPEHDTAMCEVSEWTCESGYVLNDDNTACRPKWCTCDNGEAESGYDCFVEGIERCKSCHMNFHVGGSYWGEVSNYLEWTCVPDVVA